MPRRNHRHEVYEPLDLTPDDLYAEPPRRPDGYSSIAEGRIARAERERLRVERQRAARINKGIDWSVCLVPGCGDELTWFGTLEHRHRDLRDHTTRLPLCVRHLSVAYLQARPKADEPLLVEATTAAIERREAKWKEHDKATREARKNSHPGHIYFVRLNGLIKVGWSSDVHGRLRAYGPDVEVLCIYPGTRDDETNLHRQLRPSLKVGREWYEDNAILADYVTRAVAEHGEPDVNDGWTRPKQVIRTRRRSA